jgi:hypothetical protein
MRIRIFIGVVIAALICGTGVASAKGPSDATIEGDGVAAPIELSGNEGESSAMYTLVDQTGFFPALFGQVPDPMLDQAPTTDLGPKLVITWTVPFGEPVGSGTVVQEVYPLAAGGPLTYTEPGQPFFEVEKTRGGWYQAPAAITTTLESVGVSLDPGGPSGAPPNAPPASSPEPVTLPQPVSDGGGLTVWPAIVVGLCAAIVLVGGWRLLGTRRRPRVAQT